MRMNKEYSNAVAQAENSVADIKSRGSDAIGENAVDFMDSFLTPEEISESNLKTALIGELINARREQGISQKRLEELSGVKQPVIARMEKGCSDPQLNTILKLLTPLGKTLKIVSLDK